MEGGREKWEGFGEEYYVQLKEDALVPWCRGRPQTADAYFMIGREVGASDCFFHKEMVFEEIDTANLIKKCIEYAYVRRHLEPR